MAQARINVYIKGGVLVDVVADQDVDVFLIDHDCEATESVDARIDPAELEADRGEDDGN